MYIFTYGITYVNLEFTFQVSQKNKNHIIGTFVACDCKLIKFKPQSPSTQTIIYYIFCLLEIQPWREHVKTFQIAVTLATRELRGARSRYIKITRHHRELLAACEVLEMSITGAGTHIGGEISRPYREACTMRQEDLLEEAEIVLGRFLLIIVTLSI